MTNQKGVMIAVLNQGTLRTEMSWLINELSHQNKYDLMVTYPAKKPITFNRNAIVQDFLQRKDFDYLMMMDGDNVPTVNILNLVDFQKDIIGPLGFSYQQNKCMPMVLKRNKEGIYHALQFKGNEGLVEVDAIGSGCIIISRKVLEKLRYPFRNEYDRDGVKKLGNDISFCQRAKELGFRAYCHLDYVASHHVTFDLKNVYAMFLQIENLKDELKYAKKNTNPGKGASGDSPIQGS